jgi:hypothetical protein
VRTSVGRPLISLISSLLLAFGSSASADEIVRGKSYSTEDYYAVCVEKSAAISLYKNSHRLPSGCILAKLTNFVPEYGLQNVIIDLRSGAKVTFIYGRAEKIAGGGSYQGIVYYNRQIYVVWDSQVIDSEGREFFIVDPDFNTAGRFP